MYSSLFTRHITSQMQRLASYYYILTRLLHLMVPNDHWNKCI